MQDREKKRSRRNNQNGGKPKRTHIPWEDRLIAIRRFVEENGHASVPTKWTGTERGESNLGRWVHNMRSRKMKLAEEKITQLDDCGFVWKVLGSPFVFVENAVRRARGGEEGCIVWPFAKTRGYGQVRFRGRQHPAHRLAFTMYIDKTQSNLQCIHGPCHNRACINPRHVTWGSPTDNARDKIRDGTEQRGEKNGSAKLTETAVLSIRERFLRGGVTQTALAKEVGVSLSTIHLIVNGKRWTHLV